jgi:hypothetical protein
MRGLSLHRFLLRLALSGVIVFAWLFLFDYFFLLTQNIAFALVQITFLYALSSIVTALATPLTAKILRFGVRRAIVFALLCVASAYVVMGSALEGYWGPQHTTSAIALFAILLGVYRALYWVPYKVEAAVTPARSSTLWEVLLSLAPFCGGIFIAVAALAPVWLFYIGALVIVLSMLPVAALPEIYENYSWSYRQTFHELISREHRTYVTQSILEGLNGAALLFFWPLAVFLLVGASYSMLGIVYSLTLLAALFLRAPVRALVRRLGLQDAPIFSTVVAASPWLFRLAIASPLSVVFVDSYFYTTSPRRMGIDPFAFEQATDGGSLIDEYSALKEMALSIGKVAACFIGAGAAMVFSVPVAFLIVFCVAAVSSGALALR